MTVMTVIPAPALGLLAVRGVLRHVAEYRALSVDLAYIID